MFVVLPATDVTFVLIPATVATSVDTPATVDISEELSPDSAVISLL